MSRGPRRPELVYYRRIMAITPGGQRRINLPPAMLRALGWDAGDTLSLTPRAPAQVEIRKHAGRGHYDAS